MTENDPNTDWEAAMRELRERTASSDASNAAETPPASEPPPFTPSAPQQSPPYLATPPQDGQTTGGFRFEKRTERDDRTVAGLDANDEKLLRNAYLYGGRALTAITLLSLVFYIYVGVTGGITDGFDRFTEPIEDIRDTMAREGVDAMPSYGRPEDLFR